MFIVIVKNVINSSVKFVYVNSSYTSVKYCIYFAEEYVSCIVKVNLTHPSLYRKQIPTPLRDTQSFFQTFQLLNISVLF